MVAHKLTEGGHSQIDDIKSYEEETVYLDCRAPRKEYVKILDWLDDEFDGAAALIT